MKKLKYNILFIILFMTIGIAAVSSNLIINGSTPIASNSADFNVYFANITDNSANPLENIVVSSTNKSFNFYVDVSKFNTSKATDMSNMFIATGFSNTSFNLDVSHFDTTNNVSMTQMFANLGHQSTKLQMTFTIRNPNTTSYDKMFYGAASVSGGKITVNYTNETEELVDKMIKTKITYSNVVKGELVD